MLFLAILTTKRRIRICDGNKEMVKAVEEKIFIEGEAIARELKIEISF